jgi:hypothetical protein
MTVLFAYMFKKIKKNSFLILFDIIQEKASTSYHDFQQETSCAKLLKLSKLSAKVARTFHDVLPRLAWIWHPHS